MQRFYKYGEGLMWAVLVSFLPVILIWETFDMPTGSILWWAIPAFIISTIGFILNSKHITAESERRTREYEEMVERHRREQP